MTDGPEAFESGLRRVAESSVLVDAAEFLQVLDGWTELDDLEEVSGGLILVRAGDDVDAVAIAEALATMTRPVDLIGPVDDRTAGILLDAPPPEVDDCSIEARGAVTTALGSPSWVVNLIVRGLDASAALEQGRLLLRAASRHPGGCILHLDGSVTHA